jgi:hypothetical protein
VDGFIGLWIKGRIDRKPRDRSNMLLGPVGPRPKNDCAGEGQQ